MDIRHDWYQSGNTITVDIFVKGVDKSSITLSCEDSLCIIEFDSASAGRVKRSFNLSKPVSGGSYNVYSSKLEITMNKLQPGSWPSLEETASTTEKVLEYPSSSKVKHNWNQLDKEADSLDKDEEQSVDAFFKKLYAGASEENRRAMLKSYTESGGTVLSTNWNEVGSKKVEPAPPKDAEVVRK